MSSLVQTTRESGANGFAQLAGHFWSTSPEVRFQIDRAAEQCEIPVLLLQPLVENAIRHGIAPRAAGGQLIIGARVELPDLVRLWVSDDGVGVDPGFDLSRGCRTGLGNTRARLAHLYGARAELSLRTQPGGGTIVEIVMPVAGAGAASVLASGAA